MYYGIKKKKLIEYRAPYLTCTITGLVKGKFHGGMLKGQTWVNNSLEEEEEEKGTQKEQIIKYLPVLSGEPFATLLELPSPDIRSASPNSAGPASSLAALLRSSNLRLSLNPRCNVGAFSAVTWCQWPTAKVKVEAGMGIVT